MMQEGCPCGRLRAWKGDSMIVLEVNGKRLNTQEVGMPTRTALRDTLEQEMNRVVGKVTCPPHKKKPKVGRVPNGVSVKLDCCLAGREEVKKAIRQ